MWLLIVLLDSKGSPALHACLTGIQSHSLTNNKDPGQLKCARSWGSLELFKDSKKNRPCLQAAEVLSHA